jgi:uncharacterized membrane protein
MERVTQRTAQQRVDRIAAFRAELAELEREGGLSLTDDQRSRLQAHIDHVLAGLAESFKVDLSDSARRISWGMRVVTLLGATALFAAIVLFLHRIWGLIPSLAQVSSLIVMPLVFLFVADVIFRRGGARYYVGLLACAAFAAFVMGTTAMGDTFNLSGTPQCLLSWALFAGLTAYAYGLPLLLGAALLLFGFYPAALGLALTGGWWPNFMDRPAWILPTAALIYAGASCVKRRDADDFSMTYRMCGAGLGLVALMVLSKQGDLCCSALPGGSKEGIYQLIGLAVSAGVVWHGLRLRKGPLVNLGSLAFVIFMIVRLQAWWWDWMPKYLFCLIIGLIALSLLLVFRRLRARMWEGGEA